MGERSIGEGQAVKRDECLERRVPKCRTSRRASRIENWWCMAFSEKLIAVFLTLAVASTGDGNSSLGCFAVRWCDGS